MTKKKIDAIKKSPWKRFWAKTPVFFKKLQKISVSFGTACIGMSAYILTNKPTSRLAVALGTIGGICVTAVPLVLNFAVDVEHLINEDETVNN